MRNDESLIFIYFCLIRKIDMRIYLIGYMGSGKTSVGKRLASRLEYSFLDLDRVIEEDQQQTVTEIFAQKGEDNFRSLERFALHQTFDMENVVVSTGGGTPIFFDNMDMMNAKGLCVYLQANPSVLLSRLIPNQQSRPLIASLGKEELYEFIKEQLTKRAPFYEQAELHIEARDLTPAILYNQVINWMKNQSRY